MGSVFEWQTGGEATRPWTVGDYGSRVSCFTRLINSRVMEPIAGKDVTSEEARALADELSELAKQQSLALQSAPYIKMSQQEAREYDARRLRIGELYSWLGLYKPRV